MGLNPNQHATHGQTSHDLEPDPILGINWVWVDLGFNLNILEDFSCDIWNDIIGQQQ